MDFQVFITYVNSFIIVTAWWRKYFTPVILPLNKLSLGNSCSDGLEIWICPTTTKKLPSFFHALSTLPYQLLPNPRWELNDKSPFSRVRFIDIIYLWLSGHSIAAYHHDTYSDVTESLCRASETGSSLPHCAPSAFTPLVTTWLIVSNDSSSQTGKLFTFSWPRLLIPEHEEIVTYQEKKNHSVWDPESGSSLGYLIAINLTLWVSGFLYVTYWAWSEQ